MGMSTPAKTPYPVLHCDVLVIGGGSAGAMAAIRAKELDPRCDVVVLEKGDMKYSGCIARGMDALNIVAVPGISTPELYVEANGMACEGIMDEPPGYIMAKRSWDLMKKLESWGVCFPVDDDGSYEVLQVHPKGRFCVTMKEPELKTMLAARAKELGVRVVNRSMAVELIRRDGRVAGAVAMNVRSGEIFVVSAGAVILSAGGTARFGLPNNGYLYGVYDYPGNTGDGYCLAYRAGAELSGFEYTLIYYIVKDINAPLLYITLTRGAKLLNAFGFDKSREHPSIKSMLVDHHREGSGPMRIVMSHLPEERIRSIEDILFTTERPVQERFYKGRGVDFRTGEIELWPTECFLCGGHGLTGVRVNGRRDDVPGFTRAIRRSSPGGTSAGPSSSERSRPKERSSSRGKPARGRRTSKPRGGWTRTAANACHRAETVSRSRNSSIRCAASSTTISCRPRTNTSWTGRSGMERFRKERRTRCAPGTVHDPSVLRDR